MHSAEHFYQLYHLEHVNNSLESFNHLNWLQAHWSKTWADLAHPQENRPDWFLKPAKPTFFDSVDNTQSKLAWLIAEFGPAGYDR